MTYSRLSFQQRHTIEALLTQSVSRAEIARRIGVHRSTVGHEIKRNSWKGVYTAHIAHFMAEARRLREFSKPGQPTARQTSGKKTLDYKQFRKNSRSLITYRKKRIRDFRFNFATRPKRWKRYEWKMTNDAKFRRKIYLKKRNRRHWMEGEDRLRREWIDWRFYRKTGQKIYNRKRPLRYTKEVLDPGKYFTKGIYHKHSKLERLSRSLRYSRRKFKPTKIQWQGLSKPYIYHQKSSEKRKETTAEKTPARKNIFRIRLRLRPAAKSGSRVSALGQLNSKKRRCNKAVQQAPAAPPMPSIFIAYPTRQAAIVCLMVLNAENRSLFLRLQKTIPLFSG